MISLHMLVKNEIATLESLVNHVRPYVDEVVIVDTGSTDGSFELGQKIADVCFFHPLNHDFAQARNAGLVRCKHSWVLQLDADEWPQRELLGWLRWFLDRGITADGVAIRRENLIDGKPIGENTYEWHVRLFRKYLTYHGALHERLNARKVTRAPDNLLLLHHKSDARQQRQNEFYRQWK